MMSVLMNRLIDDNDDYGTIIGYNMRGNINMSFKYAKLISKNLLIVNFVYFWCIYLMDQSDLTTLTVSGFVIALILLYVGQIIIIIVSFSYPSLKVYVKVIQSIKYIFFVIIDYQVIVNLQTRQFIMVPTLILCGISSLLGLLYSYYCVKSFNVTDARVTNALQLM